MQHVSTLTRIIVKTCSLFILLYCVGKYSAFGAESIVTYDWPVAEGQATLSNYYKVSLSDGKTTKDVQVLMSQGWSEEKGGPAIFRGRTFSWAACATKFRKPLTVTVNKLFGDGASEVEIVPSGYGIEAEVDPTGKSVRFTLKKSRYVCVYFKTPDNTLPGNVVKHMLMIFADDIEREKPQIRFRNVLEVDETTTQYDIDKAGTVVFKPGFYQLRHQFKDGVMKVRAKQNIYLAGGAYVVGNFVGHKADDVFICGRGVLSGQDRKWTQGMPTSALIELHNTKNARVQGIIACDNDMHGIVPGLNSYMHAVKFWGWHWNNDGFRPWGGRVEHCFIRPADDAFYVGGENLIVKDTVIWQSHNGAVVTCGWGSENRYYHTADFTMQDCHIIYPEWNVLGNNNGIVASQLPYAAKSKNIFFKNLRIDGDIVALCNLKRNDKFNRVGPPGGIDNVSFKDVVVTGTQTGYTYDRSKRVRTYNVIKGDGDFRISNVLFDNVKIGNVLLSKNNADAYFQIDPKTTSKIKFKK